MFLQNSRAQIFQTNLPNNNNIDNVKLLTDAARQGIHLMGKNIDYPLLATFQRYITTIFEVITYNTGINYINIYKQFIFSCSNLTPYEQVKKTVEFLIDVANRMNKVCIHY